MSQNNSYNPNETFDVSRGGSRGGGRKNTSMGGRLPNETFTGTKRSTRGKLIKIAFKTCLSKKISGDPGYDAEFSQIKALFDAVAVEAHGHTI